MMMNWFIRGSLIAFGLILLWQCVVWIFELPNYILPSPFAVFKTLYAQHQLLLSEAKHTLIESLLGLFLGTLFGTLAAFTMALFRPVSFWFFPLLIVSQALPTFAIAPLLVIWFGYGMASKIVTTIIMLFFPITNALYDGLKRTPQDWLDLGQSVNASKWNIFWHIRIPAALPSLATGLRVATAIAPIGAVVGEWVGASHGLGFLMLNANARMQIDLMFAALFSIIIFSLLLYFLVDRSLKILIFWEKYQ